MAKKREIIITCNAKQVQDTFEFLNKSLADIKARMSALNEKGDKNGWTEQMKKEFEELNKMATSINQFDLAPAEKAVRKFEDVLQNLAGSTLKDVKRALNEGKSDLNKMSENDPNRAKLTEDLAKIARQIEIIGGKSQSLAEAKKQLSDLANTPTAKLEQGLAAINKELATNAKLTDVDKAVLRSDAKNYEAQIALNKLGPINTAKPNQYHADELRTEQARLQQALSAVAQGPMYGNEAAQIRQRLQEVTIELNRQTEAERQLMTEQQKAAQVQDVLTRVNQQQKVTIDELRTAEKNLQEQIAKMEGQNLPFADQNELLQAKASLEDVRTAISQITLDGINFDNLDNEPLEELDKILKQIESDEKRLAASDAIAAKQMAENKRKVQQAIQRVKNQTMDLANAQKVANERGKHSVQDMQRAYDTLKQHLTTLSANQKGDIAKTKKQMADLKTQIDQVTGAVKKQSSTWDTAVKNITAYVGVFGAFNWIKGKIQEIFRSNVELSDSLANIRKVSGLTSGEIDQLYTNIAKIDTRNSVQQLNNLAYAGAKLGIQEHGGVAALTGFVRAAEQVQMALGEDLGEDALPAMAKLTEVMGLITQYGVEEAMQKAASAVFMLSTTSTSTGANIIEFSKRLMGLANVSHITADELLALGSASDAMGLMPEVASTAFNKVFTKIQSNTAAIEKAVGIQQGVLKTMVDDGETMKAIVTVFDHMREMSMEEMQRRGIFTALGSDGARLNNVMTTMADRVDMLKKHLQESNKAFEDGEAVIAEYMIQNETAAAYMERASNLFEKAFTNTEGVDYATNFAKEWHQVALEMTQSTIVMGQLKAALYLLAGAAKLLMAILPTLVMFLLFKGSLTAVGMLVKGFANMAKGIWACVTASKALTATQKWNLVATAVSLVAAAFVTWKSAANEAAEAAERTRERQAELDKAFVASKDNVARAAKSLEDYKKALDESNLSEAERDARLRQYLKNEFQPYLDYLGIEIDKVEDLADAYAQATYAMKQKAAAEEKESYLNNVNGENRNNRIAAQAELIREAKKMGVDIDKKWLENNWGGGASEIYNLITSKYTGTRYGEDEGWKNIGRGAYIAPAIARAANEYYAAISEERRIIKETNEKFNKEFEDRDLENFSLQDFRERQMRNQIEREKNRKNTIDMPPTKAELKAERQAEAEEKQALRKELQDAKTESDAIIAKVEEWYRLQETVITDMQADGKLTKEQADQVVRTLNIAKNTALRDARLAISGRDTKAWETTKQQIGNLMLDQGKWSQELLEQILGVSMDAIRRNLSRIDKGGGKFGITTSSLKDAVDKNAAGNQREIARLRAKSQEEVEKILLEYHYVETAIKGFSNRLAQMGILSETAQHMAERMADANDINTLFSMNDYDKLLQGNEQAKNDMLKAFINAGSQKYAVNPENKEQLRQWFMEFIGQLTAVPGASPLGENIPNVEYQYQSWAKPFEADFEMWLRNSDDYLDKIQAFYFSLIKSEDEYYEAMKKAYNKQKALFAQRWENSGRAEAYDNLLKQLDLRKREMALTGKDNGTNFADQAGFSNLNEDPEIAASIARMQQAKEELEMFRETARQKQLAGEELAAFQRNLREKEMAATEAEMAMQEQLMKSISDRISKLQEWTQPIENFGTEVGQALYDQWHNGESMTAKWQDMLKKMGLAWGQLTIKIVSELMMQRVKQNIIDKAMQADAIKHQATMSTIEQTGGQARTLVQQTTDQALIQGNQITNTIIETQQQAHNATTLSEDVGAATKETPVNISRAAGKTLAGLGWWGIPLVAVVTALLNALLQAALGSSSKNTKNEAAKTTDATKMKLVSNMLTYDSGNVNGFSAGRGSATASSHYLATDGRIYTATEEPAPKDGLITHPIATTVQGQPALVAERGPEIVIGRETTRAIMLNEPELIQYLANYHHHPRRRLFDTGNVQSVAVSQQPTSTEQDNERAALRQQMTQMQEVMSSVLFYLQHPVRPKIDMYSHGGEDGLYDSMQKATKFMSRYQK